MSLSTKIVVLALLLLQSVWCDASYLLTPSMPFPNPFQKVPLGLEDRYGYPKARSFMRKTIINGESVADVDPVGASTVALYLPLNSSSNKIVLICTGELSLANDIILTGAHCLRDIPRMYFNLNTDADVERELLIGFGRTVVNHKSDQRVNLVQVKKILVHQNYVPNQFKNALSSPPPDIALVKLNSPAPGGYMPASIGTNPDLLTNDREIILAGFGATSSATMSPPQGLMKVTVKIDNAHLNPTQFSYKVIDGKTGCLADSGGPALFEVQQHQYVVGGIASWGDEFCSQIGVYTSVPAFKNFIYRGIQELSQHSTLTQVSSLSYTESETTPEQPDDFLNSSDSNKTVH